MHLYRTLQKGEEIIRPCDSHFSYRHEHRYNKMRVLSSVVVGASIGTLLILLIQTEPCDSLFWVPSLVKQKLNQLRNQWSNSLLMTTISTAASQQKVGSDDRKRFLLKVKYYNRLSYWCSTTTVTTTTTTTISTNTFCATINGVVGACRRKKMIDDAYMIDQLPVDSSSMSNINDLVQPNESLT